MGAHAQARNCICIPRSRQSALLRSAPSIVCGAPLIRRPPFSLLRSPLFPHPQAVAAPTLPLAWIFSATSGWPGRTSATRPSSPSTTRPSRPLPSATRPSASSLGTRGLTSRNCCGPNRERLDHALTFLPPLTHHAPHTRTHPRAESASVWMLPIEPSQSALSLPSRAPLPPSVVRSPGLPRPIV